MNDAAACLQQSSEQSKRVPTTYESDGRWEALRSTTHESSTKEAGSGNWVIDWVFIRQISIMDCILFGSSREDMSTQIVYAVIAPTSFAQPTENMINIHTYSHIREIHILGGK